jgi:hypothetical protein
VFKLDQKRARLRRAMTHRITRAITKRGVADLAIYENEYKDIVQEAITSVLFEDMLEEIEAERMEAGE